MSTPLRQRRRADASKAREIQLKAGFNGAARAVSVGSGLAIIAHYFWPFFRRQTLAFKGFLVSGLGLAGLVFSAERALLEYEARRRVEENAIRKQARFELAQQGKIPSEGEIHRWITAREQDRQS